MSTEEDVEKATNAWTATDGSGMNLSQRTKKDAMSVGSKEQKEFHLTEVDFVPPREAEMNSKA